MGCRYYMANSDVKWMRVVCGKQLQPQYARIVGVLAHKPNNGLFVCQHEGPRRTVALLNPGACMRHFIYAAMTVIGQRCEYRSRRTQPLAHKPNNGLFVCQHEGPRRTVALLNPGACMRHFIYAAMTVIGQRCEYRSRRTQPPAPLAAKQGHPAHCVCLRHFYASTEARHYTRTRRYAPKLSQNIPLQGLTVTLRQPFNKPGPPIRA